MDLHNVTFSYQTVKRYARDHRPPLELFNRVFAKVGEELQVDYGEGAPTYDDRTGTFRIPKLFVATLSFSRWHWSQVVWESSQRTWCELHEMAFAFFNGTCLWVKLDNLREGVIEPDVFDPELNELYAACLAHYATSALPCRPYRPNEKGVVESSIAFVQDHLRGRTFSSLKEQNAHLLHWGRKWAYERTHGTIKRIVREAFEEEQPCLQPLPSQTFDYYTRLRRKVHRDGMIEVLGSFYSAPPEYAGLLIDVRLSSCFVRLVNPVTRCVVREHPRATQKGQHSVHPDDRPKALPPQVISLLRRAKDLSPTLAAWAATLEELREPAAVRMLLGLFYLTDRYDIRDVEAACRYGHQTGRARVGLLKAWLTRPVARRKR